MFEEIKTQSFGNIAKAEENKAPSRHVEPFTDHVLVRKEGEKKLSSGIIIPATESEKTNLGIVAAVGPGRHENGQVVPMRTRVGDIVLFPRWAGSEVWVNNEKMLLIREEDLTARMVEDAA